MTESKGRSGPEYVVAQMVATRNDCALMAEFTTRPIRDLRYVVLYMPGILFKERNLGRRLARLNEAIRAVTSQGTALRHCMRSFGATIFVERCSPTPHHRPGVVFGARIITSIKYEIDAAAVQKDWCKALVHYEVTDQTDSDLVLILPIKNMGEMMNAVGAVSRAWDPIPPNLPELPGLSFDQLVGYWRPLNYLHGRETLGR